MNRPAAILKEDDYLDSLLPLGTNPRLKPSAGIPRASLAALRWRTRPAVDYAPWLLAKSRWRPIP